MAKRWGETLLEVAHAPSDRDAHAAFVRATARAFAGTGWRPVSYNAWNRIDRVHDTVTLELEFSREFLVSRAPIESFLARPAGVPDPRFHLRGEHPKRGRHEKFRASLPRRSRGFPF